MEVVPLHTREMIQTPVSTLRRVPISVNIPPEMIQQQQHRHHLHYGQPVFPPRSLSYMQTEPKSITYQEYPLAVSQTREVNVPESTYFVETPADEPPGEREINPFEEVLPKSKILKATFKRKKPKKQFNPTPILNRLPEEEEILLRRINLPVKGQKKLWKCDTCGAMLSSKYNLIRHKVREEKKLAETGSLSTQAVQMDDNPTSQFPNWLQLPAKRTSTEAKFRTPTYGKRRANEPKTSLTYSQWTDK
jgi:hypothetical protein